MSYRQQEEIREQAPFTWSGRFWSRKWGERHFFASPKVALALCPQGQGLKQMYEYFPKQEGIEQGFGGTGCQW